MYTLLNIKNKRITNNEYIYFFLIFEIYTWLKTALYTTVYNVIHFKFKK